MEEECVAARPKPPGPPRVGPACRLSREMWDEAASRARRVSRRYVDTAPVGVV
jgi:hypothetical protein